MAIKTTIYNEASLFFEYGICISSRTLYLGNYTLENGEESDTNADSADKTIKGLHFLDQLDAKPIKIIISGYGGDQIYAFAIMDYIQTCKNKIDIDAYGPVMSAASLIFEAATGERCIAKNARLMIHYGTFAIDDSSLNVRNWSKELEKLNTDVENVYLNRICQKHPDFDREKLKEKLEFDTVMNSEESVALGLADRII